MFDKYYANKIRAKSPSSIIRPFEVNKDNENIYDLTHMSIKNLRDFLRDLDLSENNKKKKRIEDIYCIKLFLIRDEISKEISNAICEDLKEKGYVSFKESPKKNDHMEKYNNLEQYFCLDDDKEALKECLISNYISSIETFEKPSKLVYFLAMVFCDRFKQNKDVDKITLLKRRTTLKDLMKK